MDEREERTMAELRDKIRGEREMISGLLQEIFDNPKIIRITLTRFPENWQENMTNFFYSYPTLEDSKLCRLIIANTNRQKSKEEGLVPHAVVSLSFHSNQPRPLVSSSAIKMYLLGESSVIGVDIEEKPGYKVSMRDEGNGDIGETMRLLLIREAISLVATAKKASEID